MPTTTPFPSARRIGWTAVLLAALAGLYLLLRSRISADSVLSAVFCVLLIVVVLLGNLLAHAVRSGGRHGAITLPWYLLRRAIDVALLVTVGVGYFVSSHGQVQHSVAVGTLTLAADQTRVTDTVHLPAGDTAVWFAVHCSSCDHPGFHPPDATQYPAGTRIEVSGPSAASAQQISGRQAHDDVTNDQFGVREQRQIGLVHVATAGTYTLNFLIDGDYYRQPGTYRSPAVSYYLHPRILLGTPQPFFLDRHRLNILAGLLALSVLITLRPRRLPAATPGG